MKIGIAQINPIVGDLDGNLEIVVDAYQSLCQQGAELVVFPELALCGYPPRDLLLKKRFGYDCFDVLNKFVQYTEKCPALIGYPELGNQESGKVYFNSAALCVNQRIQQVFRKRLLPTYDVFDEHRYFAEGNAPMSFQHAGQKIGVSVCEDIWNVSGQLHTTDPVKSLANDKISLLINMSASPWHLGKHSQRLSIIGEVSHAVSCPVVYVNAVGGNDELVFDGGSVILDAKGMGMHSLPSFKADCQVIDSSKLSPIEDTKEDQMEDIRKALVLGLRDYAHKSGFVQGLVGLSGGIDSALTAVLAVEALGKENVIGISLPSAISSEHSKADARQLAKNLDIAYHTVPIQKIVDSAESELTDLFEGLETDVTEENLQARSRGLLLMAVSNKLGALLLTTGNKSELAVGYCTLYGDMCGGLAVISDLPKTQVFELARHINQEREIIPQNSIDKPPSAELRPDQKDSDSLPDYSILDGILQGYVEDGLSVNSIIELGYEKEVVKKIIGLVDRNEYKRKQAAPGLKITPLAFGIGRRMPIVQKYSN
ncbi:MAG: NAD+ synthase [Opitutae bacterium]